MLGMIYGVFSIGLSLGFWVLVIRFVAKGIAKKETDKNLLEAQRSQEEFRRQLAEQDAREARAALAAARAESAERMSASALVATLPAPAAPRTVSDSVDFQAVETAAYAIVMQAHEEGWIEGGDFAERAAREARQSERAAVPAAAIARHAAELRRRGGFGQGG